MPTKEMSWKWKLKRFSFSTILLTLQILEWLFTLEASGRISLLNLSRKLQELTLVRSSVLSGFGVINWLAFYCFLSICVWNFYLIYDTWTLILNTVLTFFQLIFFFFFFFFRFLIKKIEIFFIWIKCMFWSQDQDSPTHVANLSLQVALKAQNSIMLCSASSDSSFG